MNVTCVCATGAGNDSKVGVMGTGAGGNIATTIAHEVRGLSYQVGICPQFPNTKCPVTVASNKYINFLQDMFKWLLKNLHSEIADIYN